MSEAVRKRLGADERREEIIRVTLELAARQGVDDVTTQDMAQAMGVTQGAVFRHFPSKEALVERVYEHIYLSRWNPNWGPLIRDRTRSLESRLTRFYLEYVERVFDYNWVRIFVSSGLKSFDILVPEGLDYSEAVRQIMAEVQIAAE